MSILPWNHNFKNLDVNRNNGGLNTLQSEVNRLFEDFFGGMNLPASCISRSALR